MIHLGTLDGHWLECLDIFDALDIAFEGDIAYNLHDTTHE